MTNGSDPNIVASALLARYCHPVDRGPWTSIVDLFTDVGVRDIAGRRIDGRDAIHGFYEHRSQAAITSLHLVTNVFQAEQSLGADATTGS